MTTITFGISALPPGQDSSHAWNYWWTGQSDWSGDNFELLDEGPIPQSASLTWPDVNAESYLLYAGGQYLYSAGLAVSLALPWNSIKDIAITGLTNEGRNCEVLTVNGFVDTSVLAAGNDMPHEIAISGAKRGVIDLGNGNNTVNVSYLSNEYTWSNNFIIAAGNGNDIIQVQPETFMQMASTPVPPKGSGSSEIGPATSLPAGWAFNTAPDKTTANIALGSGNNTVELQECSGTITAGSGFSNISLVDGHNTLTLGSGTAMVTISAYNTMVPAPSAVASDRGSDVVQLGSGHADITIDDTMTFMTPVTTIVVSHGETGNQTTGGADNIRYGHGTGATFVGGDWNALTLDLVGYSAGSSTRMTESGDHTDLIIQDKAGGPPDVLSLYGTPNILSSPGAVPVSIAALHLQFN